MKTKWIELCKTYSSNQESIEQIWQIILKRHSEPHRFYHNLNHLEYLLNLIEYHRSKINKPNLMMFSVFMHDIIYDTSATDNEEKSAEQAVIFLLQLNINPIEIQYIKQQILASKKHEFNTDSDTNIFLDFDLGILSGLEHDYKLYSQKIRQEYQIYNDEIYYPGRKLVLESFLQKKAIYHTNILGKDAEQKARLNIKYELKEIG